MGCLVWLFPGVEVAQRDSVRYRMCVHLDITLA